MELKSYLKYYWLEKEYLEEVRLSFHSKGYLTAEELLAIVEWKNPKFGKTRLSHVTDEEVRDFSHKVHEASSQEEKLEILLCDGTGQRKGIKLATASAILTILYPTEFTVYDVRVRSLWDLICPEDRIKMYPDITYEKNVIERYVSDYLSKVKRFAEQEDLSLRNCDRALWAKSWHDDLQKFLAVADNSV